MVEEAVAEGARYQYRIRFEYDPNLGPYSTGRSFHFRRDEVPPPVLLTSMEILDTSGKSVRDQSTGGGCSACGTAAPLRYRFALLP